MQTYTPTVVQGGGLLQPLPPWVFTVLQYLGNILPLIDSLSGDLRDKVNIVGYSTTGTVIQNGHQDGRHLGFYLKFKLLRKTWKLQTYFAGVVKYDISKHFASFW